MKNKVIYLDSHATTPVSQDVLHAMKPFFDQYYGNGNHKAGWTTNTAMEKARHQVSSIIGARSTEVIFTSGATESINLALLGLAKANQNNRKHIITQRTEHSAVLKCIEELKRQGFRITILEVDEVGRIDLNELKRVISDDTLVVAIMLANNEIGTIQPVKEIGAICRKAGAKFFCDLTQGIGWHPISVDEMKIDLAAMSSHKIYGPRGVGALFIRRFRPKTTIRPILFGGGQERGLRPGTSNIPAIVGFGKACEIQQSNSEIFTRQIRAMRDKLQDIIFSSIENVKLNGCPKNRHPGNLNLSIPNVSGEDLIGALPNIIFSTGSACTSGSMKPSYVISAINTNQPLLTNAFRFGIGRLNTMEEINYVGKKVVEITKQLQLKRNSSPVIVNA